MTAEDRAVSDVVGYILVFSLIVTSIGVVFATGFAGLDDAREAEQRRNVERAFDVLDANLDDVRRRGAPARETEMRLSGGTLRHGEPIRVTVNATNAANESDNATFSMNPRPLIYEKGETRIVYVGGAVLRSDGDAHVMLSDPPADWDADATVIPFVVTYPGDDGDAIGGDATVLVRADRFARGLGGSFENGTVELSVTVQSPRATAWERYLEDAGLTVVESDGTHVTAEFTTDQLYVHETIIELALAA